jgi:DNA-binding NarL/FixJ family response regulator
MKARILIADDHELVRDGLRGVLVAHGDWEICAEAVDGREAVERARELRPDVAILDYSMPQLNGLEATRQICAAVPETEVLILTMHDSESLVREVLAAGARGFILKSDARRVLVQAVESLLRHRPFFTEHVSELLLQGYLGPDGIKGRGPLTPRERQIVQLVTEGRSSKEIARLLNLSVKTVETHRANVLHKLGLESVTDLVRYAVRNKIIEA